MRKLLWILLSVVFAACSNEPEPIPAPAQDYTSVVFVHNVENQTLSDCSVGYYTGDTYNKISDLEDMTTGEYSEEITLPDEVVDEIFLFTRYPLPKAFTVQKNVKNVFELSGDDINKMASAKATINGADYNVTTARYEIGYSRIFNDDIVRLYIDLTDNGGIIIEMSKQLSGQKVSIEPRETFWFFSIGDGKRPFQSFANTDRDFEGYTGWFVLELDEQNSGYFLDFELEDGNGSFAYGNMSGFGERIEPNI